MNLVVPAKSLQTLWPYCLSKLEQTQSTYAGTDCHVVILGKRLTDLVQYKQTVRWMTEGLLQWSSNLHDLHNPYNKPTNKPNNGANFSFNRSFYSCPTPFLRCIGSKMQGKKQLCRENLELWKRSRNAVEGKQQFRADRFMQDARFY